MPTDMSRPAASGLTTSISTILALVMALVLVGLPDPARGARFPYDEGELVKVNGVVTDSAGEPIEDLEVVLEASRKGLSLRPFGMAKKEVARGSSRTTKSGEFGLEWKWRRRFNHFEVLVTLPVKEGDRDRLSVLRRIDITRRVKQGSPVAVPVTVEDRSTIDAYRSFMATLDSEDERRVHRELGRPDRIEEVRYPDRDEVSWWYFSEGKVYRFVDGELADVTDFDPVRPIEP